MKFIGIIILSFLYFNSFSQSDFDTEASKITVLGTSSLHDWESQVIMGDVKVELHIENTDPLLLGHLRLTIPVTSIKSGENMMDRKTYEALKADAYPILKYEVEVFDYREGEVVASDGILIVAGKEKRLPVTAKYTTDQNAGAITFTGYVSFKMTDFEISPPTAVFGTIKTGDQITIQYEIIVKYS